MSAIWLPKGWLWGTKGVTFGTLGDPWEPQGAKTRPWKGQDSEMDDYSTVVTHVRLSWRWHWKGVAPGDDQVMRPFGLARGAATKLRGHLALSLEAM